MEGEEHSIQPENYKDGYLEERVTGNDIESPNGAAAVSSELHNLNHIYRGSRNGNEENDVHDEANINVSSNLSSVSSSSSLSLTSSLSSSGLSQSNKVNGYQTPTQSTENLANPDSLVPYERMEMSHALTERVSIIDSIKWLGNHLPESVVAFLIDEIEVEEAETFPVISYETQYNEIPNNAGYQSSMVGIHGSNSAQYQYDETYQMQQDHSILYQDQHSEQCYPCSESSPNTHRSSMYKEYYPGDFHHEYNSFPDVKDHHSLGRDDRDHIDSTVHTQSAICSDSVLEGKTDNSDQTEGAIIPNKEGTPCHILNNNNTEDQYNNSCFDRKLIKEDFGQICADENDSLDAPRQGPLHFEENQIKHHSFHDSLPDLRKMANRDQFHENFLAQSESCRRVVRRSSLPLVVRSIEGRQKSIPNNEGSHILNNNSAEDQYNNSCLDSKIIKKDVGQICAHENDSLDLLRQEPVNSEENEIKRNSFHDSLPDLRKTSSREQFHEDFLAQSEPRRRVFRRSSLPLVVRSMEGRHNSSDESHFSDSSVNSGSSFPIRKSRQNKAFYKQMARQRISTKVIDLFGTDGTGSAGHFADERNDSDPSEFLDFKDERQKKEVLRKRRFAKTRDSITQLCGNLEMLDLSHELDAMTGESEGDHNNMYFTDTIPPATRHDCALLFVDISGFTKVSMTLDVEALSKTINNYFQMIVDEVEAFGGDILKFAGDAVFCEWQATISNRIESGDGNSLAGSSQGSIEPWHGLGLEECVLTAAACGARIVKKCSDYPVYYGGGSSGTQVGTLNIHCGVGFGEVVGVHVGDRETRMEYLILGDPIDQVADAILVASRGQIVASPEALVILEETTDLSQHILDSDMDKPQVIASKSKCFFNPLGTDHVQQDWTVTLQDFTTKPRERLARRCDDWSLSALTRLCQRMALYVHPVVVNDEFALKMYPGDRSRPQKRHRSEAELRDVYTVFIMPLITARLTGDDEEDCKVLILLNDIMLTMTRELARFKGHLRQFIVDDKGVVLIANFGLRGSTFPNMVAERAIPFTTTVQSLLRAELNTECQIGATFDKAYCGVVGGVSRHEYAILGPSVNLAARLMGNPKNTGFLVDVSVKEKAGGSRKFRALAPVKAKGYKRLVPIFEPLQTTEKTVKGLTGQFVGRENELNTMLLTAEDIVKNGGHNRLIIINGAPGSGKSALCLEASNQIKEMCAAQKHPHLSICTVCSERDAFVPFSVTRPLFLEILRYINDESEHPDTCSGPHKSTAEQDDLREATSMYSEGSQSMIHLVQILEVAEIPDQFIEILGKLILTRNRADVADGQTNSSYMAMMNSIAQYIVKAFLHCTIAFDLVLLVLDDVSNMDEMSWKVVELLYIYSHNTLIIGTRCQDDELKVDKQFWERLHSQDSSSEHFSELTLPPIEVEQLIANSLEQKRGNADSSLSHAAFVQPEVSNLDSNSLAVDEAEKCKEDEEVSQQNLSETSPNPLGIESKIEEFVIHRIDRLPSSVRTYLNLGAILGPTFELLDVVTVFEQYRELRGVQTGERLKHAKSVHASLEDAVKEGILEIATGESALHTRYTMSEHPYASENTTYKFTHEIWIRNILSLILDEWKKEMHSLIAQSMERVIDSQLANDNRVLKRLFSHWKGSGNAKKAAAMALKMGCGLEEIGLTHRSLIIYKESLDMYKAMDSNKEECDETLGGVSIELLTKLDSSDIENLIKLNVSLGRCYTNVIDPQESIRSFQTALNLIHKAPSSVLLEDRSIIFPVFSGLFVALRFGQNDDLQYEQGLVRMFLRETSNCKDSIHYSRALAMQAEMLAKHGDFELALETAQKLCEIYDVEEHSDLISKAYGSDRCGQCISQIALWSEQLNNTEGAIDICDFVIADLIPKMDPQNVHNLFHMLYPIIGIMKNHGRALEARDIFEKYVIENYQSRYDAHHGLTSDKPLHMPIMVLLDLIGSDCKTMRLTEYSKWILVEQNGLFETELNFITGSLGRTADSLIAEICLLLAQHTDDRGEQSFFIRKGLKSARDAIEITRQKCDSHGMIVAYTQIKPIYEALDKLYSG